MIAVLKALRRTPMDVPRRRLVLLAALLPLAASAVTLNTVIREVAYTYDPNTGQVLSEQVDPGQAQCVETAYELDGYGNRIKTTVRPCPSTSAAASFPARVSVNEYTAGTDPSTGLSYPAGAYLSRTYTGNLTTTLSASSGAYDPRFGAAIQQTAVALADTTKNLTNRTVLDSFGRVSRQFAPVKRQADNSVLESFVEYNYVSCYPTLNPGCLTYATTLGVDYASRRLVDTSGAATSTAAVSFISAYFVEATPYDSAGRLIGAISRLHYDALNREIAKESQAYDQTWNQTLTGYDPLGLVALTYAAHKGRNADGSFLPPPAELRQATPQRDLAQRPLAQTRYWRAAENQTPTELTTRLAYNGLETVTTDPNGRTAATRKSPLGQTIQTLNADDATLNTAYDPVGNLVTTVDALGNTTTVRYTSGSARFKTALTDPDMGAWSYSYDALGQLRQQTDARGVVTRMSYDDLGRLINKSTPNFVSKWYYDQDASGSPCAFGLNRLCYSQLGASTPVNSQKIEYDNLGRAIRSTALLDRTYVNETSFDDLGRPLTLKYPTGFTIRYAYSSAGSGRTPGILQQVADNANAARIFWRIDTLPAGQVFDAQGHLKTAALGNGVLIDNHYDPISGKAFALKAGVGGSTSNIASQTLVWDQADNLSNRTDDLTAVAESFQYDRLDRLIANTLNSTTDLAASRTVTARYNAIGNLLVKSDVGGYVYAADKPHAVRSAANTTYTYDANGSLTTTAGMQARNQTWNDFNQPDSLRDIGGQVDFIYDADYKRVKETARSGATTRTVYLVHPDNVGGLGFEREETRVGNTLTRNESRHYISVGGTVIAVVKTLDNTAAVSADPSLTHYWHKDALGSITAVTSATGQVLERTAFDAWGRRLTPAGRASWNLDPANGNRGFTGHEHLDEVGLIHMNGRVYDPILARFLSADSIVEQPGLLQSHNRYSYALNNPLRYTDPSGHCVWDFCIAEIAAVVAGYELTQHGNSNWRMIGSLMMMVAGSNLVEAGLGSTAATFNIGNVGNAFTTAFSVNMVTSGGNFDQSLQSALFASAFSLAGTYTHVGTWQKFASHALIGCVQSASSGGKCGPGAAAAIIGEAAGEFTAGMNSVTQGVVASIAGGTASVIGGGKFASGAYQAGFAYVFNELAHPWGTARERLALAGYGGQVAKEGDYSVQWKDNFPNTIPVDGGASDALQCTANCIGKNVFATGGQEQWKDGIEGGTRLHSANSAHYENTAVDFRALDVASSKVLSCSANCGFRAGWWENWGNPHWHFQLNTSPSGKPPTITADPLVPR